MQIRTKRMDEVAERGLAAHWRYKGVKSGEGGLDDWLNSIRSALENNVNSMQMIDEFKMDHRDQGDHDRSKETDLQGLHYFIH